VHLLCWRLEELYLALLAPPREEWMWSNLSWAPTCGAEGGMLPHQANSWLLLGYFSRHRKEILARGKAFSWNCLQLPPR